MDLACIGMVCMVVGPVLMILSWPIAELATAISNRREKKKANPKKLNTPKFFKKADDRSFGNPYLQRFYEAIDKGDREEAVKALEECKAHCSSANSWCLTEMFCTECPMAGMPVQSGRAE